MRKEGLGLSLEKTLEGNEPTREMGRSTREIRSLGTWEVSISSERERLAEWK